MTAYNIKKSHRVFLFGKGDSRISLENFKNKMIKLNEYFIIGDEYQNNFYTVGNITSNDLVIFCTYSAMHHDYNSYLPVLKDHNVPIITITSNIHSKLAVNSDIVLQLPDDESFDEKVASLPLKQIWILFLITSILSFSRKIIWRIIIRNMLKMYIQIP